jgi:hypothetical protein
MPTRSITLLFVLLGVVSCGSSNEPAKSAVNCTKVGANTGVAGAKTGLKTGVEGVKTFGKAVGGLVEGGSDEAKKQWQEGKEETKRTAHEGADETKREAKAPDCP